MNNFNIKPFDYSFSDEDIKYILDHFETILRSHAYLTMGEYGEQFEKAFREYNHANYAIAVSNGTAALEIILKALNVQGGKVIVPTNTFGATVISILAAGAEPVFADCGPDMAISPQSVAAKMSKEVKAVVTVHIGGLISMGIYELQAVCEEWNVPLVEDAAHATGSLLDGKRAGDFGIASAFSFFNTKIITTGEGGMITTRDAGIDEKARLMRNHAKSQGNRMEMQGYNWRLPEIQSILGIRQLQHLDEFIQKRTAIAHIYDELLGDLPFIRINQPAVAAVHNYYKYIIILESIEPEAVRKRLIEEYNIPLGGYVYEEPCHKQPAFVKFGGNDLSSAEKLCSSHICLPIYQEMSAPEARYVGESVRTVLEGLHNS
jgi:dTDP-4-amino-4,6-dideoxygalactose transaminase